MKPDRLEKIPLFAGLSEDELKTLGGWTDEVEVPAGKFLVRQGAYPHEFMVIEDGTVEVTHDDTRLAELGPGDFFGEMALLSSHPRMASIVALSDVRLVVMHERNFRAMEESMPLVAERVRAVMDDRRKADEERGIEP
ncbi:MAG TPA: cyclic nucleotide-binding domain-containing protein [Actinomycetota bacterium]|nr:cyclic nucleotide-binding domain-containing protein [Actinomycetota bacterium]